MPNQPSCTIYGSLNTKQFQFSHLVLLQQSVSPPGAGEAEWCVPVCHYPMYQGHLLVSQIDPTQQLTSTPCLLTICINNNCHLLICINNNSQSYSQVIQSPHDPKSLAHSVCMSFQNTLFRKDTLHYYILHKVYENIDVIRFCPTCCRLFLMNIVI